MFVHLMQIPHGETLHIEGEEDPQHLELEAAGATPLGPLCYSLDVGISEGGVFATGRLAIQLQFTCVATLEPLEYEIVVDPFAMQKMLGSEEQIDLMPEIREDIHLALPAHPRNAEADLVRFSATYEGIAQETKPSPWQGLDKLQD